MFVFNRAENMAQKAAREEPLPEEDPSNPVFKPIPEPPRLDSFLITNQISNYCNQINGYATIPFSSKKIQIDIGIKSKNYHWKSLFIFYIKETRASGK